MIPRSHMPHFKSYTHAVTRPEQNGLLRTTMKLLSIKLRCFRVHQNVTVKFDALRTLIGGPNEIGKTTIADALRYVLFLKAKGNTEHHRAMKSHQGGGVPEVELMFVAGGITYRLTKRFGSSGQTTLNAENSTSISGSEAETELARILNADPSLKGKSALAQWAHLLVAQGESAQNPSAHATAQSEALVARLQAMGTSALLQSELDTQIATYFSDQVADTFTQKAKPKTGSNLHRATLEAQSTQEALRHAQAQVDKLSHASIELASAQAALGQLDRANEALNAEQQKLDERTRSLGRLKEEEFARKEKFSDANRKLADLQDASQRIEDTRAEVRQLEVTFKPLSSRISARAELVVTAKQRLQVAEREYAAARDSVRKLADHCGLASAHARRIQLEQRKSKLETKARDATSLKERISALNESLLEIPLVDNRTIAALRELESDCMKARTMVESMGAGLEVVSTDQSVTAGGKPIEQGQYQVLTQETDIEIGQDVKLRITPGGGMTLSECKEQMAAVEAEFSSYLVKLGIGCISDAVNACMRRTETQSQIQKLQSELVGKDAADVHSQLEESIKELTEVKLEIEQRVSRGVHIDLPNSAIEASSLLQSLQKKLVMAEDRESGSLRCRDEARTNVENEEASFAESKLSTKKQSDELGDAQTRLRLLIEMHNQDGKLAFRLKEAATTNAKAKDDLSQTQTAIKTLDPDALEADGQRLERAAEQQRNTRHDLTTRIAVAQSILRTDGQEDPQVSLANAKALAERAEESLKLISRDAQAAAMLDRLFQEEQRQLADRFTQPLAEKISDYLAFVFGTDAKATIQFQQNAFTGLQISRPNGTFEFDSLSSGAKEQLAAAVRLAMTEVLLAEHDGHLPIVFDDAFACSDPTRIQALQRMLDHAARRGIQVIAFSCSPQDYAALGAKQVTLKESGPTRDRLSNTTYDDSVLVGS